MTEQDKINSETQMKLALQDAKFAVFMSELKEQREDIRQLNTRIDLMNTRIDSKFDSLTNQIHNLREEILGKFIDLKRRRTLV